MTKNEIVGRLKDGGLDASSTNRRAAVYVADAMAGRAVPGWFAFRIVCDSEDTERRARAILSRWYDIDVNGNGVWRLKSKNRVPLMAIKRGSGPTPPPPTPTDGPLCLEAVEANSTVSLMSALATAPNLEYSTDGETWQEWQHTTQDMGGMTMHNFDTLTLTAVGDKVYLRGDNPTGLSTLSGGTKPTQLLGGGMSMFQGSGKCNASGCILSLVSKENYSNITTFPQMGFLFSDFNGNTNIKLLTAPSFGNVTELADYAAIGMFSGQSLMETAPDLSKITKVGKCGCGAEFEFELEAGMLTVTAITSVSIGKVTQAGEYAFGCMLLGCYNLTEIKCLATDISATGCTDRWVDNVAASGTFIKDPSMSSWTEGDNGIPTGWTVVDNVTP